MAVLVVLVEVEVEVQRPQQELELGQAAVLDPAVAASLVQEVVVPVSLQEYRHVVVKAPLLAEEVVLLAQRALLLVVVVGAARQVPVLLPEPHKTLFGPQGEEE